MLVSLFVSNFRSFHREETFSLVASNRVAGAHADHAVPIPDSQEKVLKTAVIYGANGAGKSNLFRALAYVRSIATETRPKGTGMDRQPFLFADSRELTTCDLQFVAVDRLYRYGFKVDDARVVEEWLVRLTGGREETIFERETDDTGGVTVRVKPGSPDKIVALAKVGGPPNQSFLATSVANLNLLEFENELANVLGWFRFGLNMITPTASFAGLNIALSADENLNKFAAELLRAAGTGVTGIRSVVEEVQDAEARSAILEGLGLDPIRPKYGTPRSDVMAVDTANGRRWHRTRTEATHAGPRGSVLHLPIEEESDGTRRLLEIAPTLRRTRFGSVHFIDELDRSLHPLLAREFLQAFIQSSKAHGSQIIVTTHESSLLDLDLLRRDEIWFAEKDEEGATRLYSLLDFKVRNDLEIRKHYLQGRFGAVPFLGDFQKLLDEPAAK